VTIFPASAIIPTLDRPARLARTLQSVFAQDYVPAEIVIVDASGLSGSAKSFSSPPAGCRLLSLRAERRGAAAQRNQGVTAAGQPYILFLDDDVDLEPRCLRALWTQMEGDATLGGCNAVITNQHYHPPGKAMRRWLSWLGCPAHETLAGRCCGPALNFLPELAATAEADIRVEWLNLGCTLYRAVALPRPPFLDFFHGYSLMEDAALALQVGRRWRLASVPSARLFHDTQPSPGKDNVFARERMEVVNRWFVMREVMDRRSLGWDLRQLAYQLLMLLPPLRQIGGWKRLPAALAGKLAGLTCVVSQRRLWRGYSSSP
jgi:glycosyltransferase involved in cell wall biosynthesis